MQHHGSNVQVLANDGEHIELRGFRPHRIKQFAIFLSYILTFGVLRLVFHWIPRFKLLATHQACSFQEATSILITDIYKNKHRTYFVEEVKTLDGGNGDRLSYFKENGVVVHVGSVRAFTCKTATYLWSEQQQCFERLIGLQDGVTCADLHGVNGLSSKQAELRRVVYGMNIIQTPLQSVFELFLHEALTPFYVFQVFSITVWMFEQYYYYSIAIVVMSIYGISSTIIQTRRNQLSLYKKVHMSDNVVVKRPNGEFSVESSFDLVAGDIIVIPDNGGTMHCDAVLLNGTCVVNESMLTGESVPIIKDALPSSNEKRFDLKTCNNHVLHGGTKVIQTKRLGADKVLAVVLRTGFLTTKGQLIQSIMYPPPADFKFDKDSYKYIWILSFIGMCGVIYSVILKSSHHLNPIDILLKTLDTLSIIIPPALPAAMTNGKLYAVSRLQRKRIYCINSRVINVSGSIDCICFDKTGTLTEDGLDIFGIVATDKSTGNFKPQLDDVSELEKMLTKIIDGMATCHSLSLIDGRIDGDPLDLKMFEFTQWQLQENETTTTIQHPSSSSSTTYTIVHQNHFASNLQRMSVVVRNQIGDYIVYCKGAPEMVATLCRPRTLSHDFHERLRSYTVKGYRVLAMATKPLAIMGDANVKHVRRDVMESDLEFLGFIVFENKVKPLTGAVIRSLRQARMKVVMITGDNIETAVSVAKETGFLEDGTTVVEVQVQPPTKHEDAKLIYNVTKEIKYNSVEIVQKYCNRYQGYPTEKYHFIMVGQTWSLLARYFHADLAKFVTRGTIFARMTSEQKQHLVEELQALDYYVCMCGDGTNDCGALRAAHVGISLSESEASVASPLTSQTAHISCVTDVIREGRAALVTSFGTIKLMVAYSLIEYTSVMVLFTNNNYLTNMEFLFIDIAIILIGIMVFGNTQAHTGDFYPKPPMTSLLSVVPLTSLLLFTGSVILFQAFVYHVIQTFSWFVPFEYKGENVYDSHENFAVFAVSMFQYISLFIIFSKGYPYRRPIYTNRYLMAHLSILTALCLYIAIKPDEWTRGVLGLVPPPQSDGTLFILLIIVINFIFAYVLEEVFVDFLLHKKILIKYFGKNCKKYQQVEEMMANDSKWSFALHDYDNDKVLYETDYC